MATMAKLGWHGTRTRKSGKFQARWCDADGLQSLGGFISKTQAVAYAVKMANEALNVMVGLSIVRKPIQAAREAFLDRRTKANTRALNQRRVDEFLAAMPEIRDTSFLTKATINKYARILETQGHNPGGQEHHLKIVRAFCKFCLKNKWIAEHPFEDFLMPSSEYEARPLTDAEYDLMLGVGGARNQHKEVDIWLNWAFRFGHSTMLRISQVWKLTPADFREPNLLKVEPIKGQEPVTLVLQPEAVEVLKEMPIRAQQERYFSYWGSVESMRNSVEDKARRVGLEGVRFHDVCKVTRISNLSADGVSPADLSHLSNTSKETLIKHYIKSDRDRAFANYAARPNTRATVGHIRATNGPNNEGFVGHTGDQPAQEGTISTVENASISQPIPTL